MRRPATLSWAISYSRFVVGIFVLLLTMTAAYAQDFFPVRRIRLGRLQLSELHVRQATVSEGEGEQGDYKEPVRLVFDSGRITLFGVDNSRVLLSGRLLGGSVLSATFICNGGPCVAPNQLSIDPDGMKLTITVEESQMPGILGTDASVKGSTVKMGGSTPLLIKKDQSTGTLLIKSSALALNDFHLRLTSESEPIVVDLASIGESQFSLDLTGDAWQLQKATLAKSGFVSSKPYHIVLEGQTITGPELTAARIAVTVPAASANPSVRPTPALASAQLSDLILKKPAVHLGAYPDYDIVGVAEVDCHVLSGNITSIPQHLATLTLPVSQGLVAQPDPIQIINKLNATAQGKSILPTGNPNVRYIHAQVLRNLYQALGITEDEGGTVGRTIYLPVKDGVIYDILPGTYPIKDPVMTDPPVVVEAVGMVVGGIAGEAGGELLGDLLKKPLRDASLGLSLNSMFLDPRLGVPVAWISYQAGTFGTKKVGEKLGEVPAETVVEAGGELVENVLVEPVLHSTDLELASALVRYLEVPPPLIPPTSVNVGAADNKGRALEIRKERIAFISTDALTPSTRQALPPAIRKKIESYERQLEWAVNNKFTFRQDVGGRIEPAWQSRQSTKIGSFLSSADSVEQSRSQQLGYAAVNNGNQSAQQENLNTQEKAQAIGQMQQQMDSQMSGFQGGMTSSYGDYKSGAGGSSSSYGPGTPQGMGSNGTVSGGTMSQGQGCRDMYQGCFQLPGATSSAPDDPFIVNCHKRKTASGEVKCD